MSKLAVVVAFVLALLALVFSAAAVPPGALEDTNWSKFCDFFVTEGCYNGNKGSCVSTVCSNDIKNCNQFCKVIEGLGLYTCQQGGCVSLCNQVV
ncbi:hypothetical protein DFJ74DRAFT_709638 [Hyaloraphidium curvatum]|nr:hypothetical protein DFJ74DRAFT_709638 [Hyaloraphidium curvatum]